MASSRFGYRTPIPSISTSKGTTKSISYKDGRNTYKDNDDLKPTELLEVIDARFAKIGRYRTRKGLDRYSVPIGEAVSAEITSTVGASTFTVNGSQALAQKVTATRTERITRAEVLIRSTAISAGVLLVEYYTDKAGQPGDLIARSSIRPADVPDAFTWLPVYFHATPAVTNGQVLWQVIRAQNTAASDYEVSTTTSATTALTSADSGTTWLSSSFSANVRLYTAPYSPVKGLIRAYRPNGQKVTLFAANDSIYSVDPSTGATTVIKSGLNAAATQYRFWMVQDAVYFVNGLEKPYRYDFTTVDQMTQCPIIPDDLMEHKGLIFYKDAEDKTKFVYTNFAEYDVFTSTDFIYAPAPKSYDSLTALAKLNGVFFLFAKRNKFQLYGSDNDTFSLDEAASQRGTFSQESVVFDANFIYHADEEGVWQFNGTGEVNLAESFQEEYRAITNKDSICLDVYQNRLYIFYASAGSARNDECMVYNLQLNRTESHDLNTPIGRTFSRYAQDDVFIQASNTVAALYYGEQPSNDYHNLGDQLQYELRTSYGHFDTPGQLKRIPKYRPVFPSVVGDYTIQVGYAKDMDENVQWTDVSVSGGGYRYNTGKRYNTGLRYTGTKNIEPTGINISGTFKRLQRRFRHVAAREPVEVDSEMMTVEVQRMI